MPDPIVADELRLLEKVNDALARAEGAPAPSEKHLVSDLQLIRNQLNNGELDFYERSSLTTRMNVQSALLQQLHKSRAAETIDPGSPYFGHMRIEEAGRTRDLCLGRATRLDNGLRIVDWRHAPIAQLFYRYQQGEEFEENISGRLQQGTVVARRTVTIRAGRLERVEAPDGVWTRDAQRPENWQHSAPRSARLSGGEGAALRVHAPGAGAARLGRSATGQRLRPDKHLPDIAGLLDPEQFNLIARPASGFLAIRGAAGSGKTTVALHRIAFLAYHEPAIDSEQTLFIALSPALRSYVSHVLPALGVAKVPARTFQEWASAQRRRLFPALPRHPRENTSALAQRVKLHPALLVALEQQGARAPGAATPAQALDDWVSVLRDAKFLCAVFAEHAPDAFRAEELHAFARRNVAQTDAVLAYAGGERDAAEEAALDPEDDALLLRAFQLRVGPLLAAGGAPLRYRHIAVDEVQDFSPVELRVLMDCLDEGHSLTLAGDARQQVLGGDFPDWSEFLRQLGIAGAEVETLQVSYRSSAPIMRFANAVLGDDEPLLTTRDGPPVEVFEYEGHGACITALGGALATLATEEPLASVAVLAPTPELAALYHEGLARCELPRLHHVRKQDFRFTPGIEVSDIVQAKGLEFDYVVLVGVDAEHFDTRPESRRLLHVAATRAVHQLWVTSTTPRSPLLPVS